LKKLLITIVFLLSVNLIYSTQFAIIKTNYGDIKIRLYKKEAPITVNNFIKYSKTGRYKNTLIYRVIKGVLIQGGGYKKTKNNKIVKIREYKPIKSEADNGLFNVKGSIAMARTENKSNSATSNFFINLRSNFRFNYNYQKTKTKSYTVFGKVINGWDTINQISNLKTVKKNYFNNYPKKEVVIENIAIIKSDF